MPIFDANRPIPRRRRFQRIPVRMLVPNVITLLAICAGLTAIRLGIEQRFELALGAIVFAAILDGIDGRVARLIKGQSRFGAELDSLADFVNFGVAPALLLYLWQLHELNNIGWISAMIFAISGGLRLARFNATMDDPDKPAFGCELFYRRAGSGGRDLRASAGVSRAGRHSAASGCDHSGLHAARRLFDDLAAAGLLGQEGRNARRA